MMSSFPSDTAWYVLRVTYQRELFVKERLDRMNVENFIPIRTVRRRNAQGRFCRVKEVAVHNYIFVRSTRPIIDDLKSHRLPMLRYVMCRDNGQSRIMTVPEQQMNHFIAVAGNADEQVLFLMPEEVDLSEGDPVRITGGIFEGVEGVFMRVHNTRQRRVVVKIDGVSAVATTTVPSAFIERI